MVVVKPIIFKRYHEYHLNGKLRIKYNPKYSIGKAIIMKFLIIPCNYFCLVNQIYKLAPNTFSFLTSEGPPEPSSGFTRILLAGLGEAPRGPPDAETRRFSELIKCTN